MFKCRNLFILMSLLTVNQVFAEGMVGYSQGDDYMRNNLNQECGGGRYGYPDYIRPAGSNPTTTNINNMLYCIARAHGPYLVGIYGNRCDRLDAAGRLFCENVDWGFMGVNRRNCKLDYVARARNPAYGTQHCSGR